MPYPKSSKNRCPTEVFYVHTAVVRGKKNSEYGWLFMQTTKFYSSGVTWNKFKFLKSTASLKHSKTFEGKKKKVTEIWKFQMKRVDNKQINL